MPIRAKLTTFVPIPMLVDASAQVIADGYAIQGDKILLSGINRG